MQQRVSFAMNRAAAASCLIRGSALALAALLTALHGGTAAGAAGRGQNEPALPTILLVQDRPGASSLQSDDLNVRIKTTLREAIVQSGRYQVHTFIPGEAVIKRALTEHLIAAEDLAEPHKPESLQRIARAIGARFILELGTTLDKEAARTQMKFMDNPNVSDWIVVADERMTVSLLLGRKRLKPDDIVSLTVDSITARIGIPTHLAGTLKQVPGSKVFGGPAPERKKPDRAIAKNHAPAPDTVVTRGADQSAVPPPTVGGRDLETPVKSAPQPVVKAPRPPRTARAPKNDPPKKGLPKPDPKTPTFDPPARPVFTNEADPSRSVLPAQPAVAPAPVVARPDYEAQAARYRQTGDVSNAVVSLRKAVNERPRDIGLRRQLIQAYQSGQMPEAAHAEALRALRMDAGNVEIYRLYGEVLMAEGDLPGAMQAFKEGIRIDPTSISCQVALGDVLLADSHHAQALEAYAAASKSDPKSPAPHRRIARALAAKAATDTDQYQASLAELRMARELTLPADTASYAVDYIAIVRLVEGRIREMLDELQSANQARVQAKRTRPELLREIADVRQRCAALADYLDKLPPAVGHDVTQAHYIQANSLFAQAVGFFKDLVEKGDDRFADSMKTAQVQSQHELTVASQRLTGVKAPEKPREP